MNELTENPIGLECIQEPPFEVWFHSASGKFLTKDSNQSYMSIGKDLLKSKLQRHGLNPRTQQGEYLSERDTMIDNIIMAQNVDYAGQLSGYYAGLHTINNTKILVTKSPTIIKGENKPFPLLAKIFDGLFNSGDIPQLHIVYGWLKLARESIVNSNPTPGQCLVLAGPRNCGKSLFQDIVTEILGGRIGKPYSYMAGKTEFNSDLFAAEHWVIADEIPHRDISHRRAFGARIKDCTVNKSMQCQGKFKESLTLTPCKRLTISLNDEPENLMILPPLDESLIDKIIMLKVATPEFPLDSSGVVNRHGLWNTIKDELPGLIYHIEQFTISEEHRDTRFGLKAFQHPELLSSLDEMNPENKLLELIDEGFFISDNSWEGTSAQLEVQLIEGMVSSRLASRILTFPNAISTYLKRLKKRLPDRISTRESNSKTLWRITQAP